MNDDPLTRLQEQLKAHPPEARDAVYEELVANRTIDAADEPSELIAQLKDEEAAESSSTRLKNFLWAAVPTLLLMFSTMFGIMLTANMETAHVWIMLATTILSLVFAFVGARRRSLPLQAFWLGSLFSNAQTVMGMASLSGVPDWIPIVGVGLIGVALVWLGRVIYQSRRDLLIFSFALYQLLESLIGSVASTITFDYANFDQMIQRGPITSVVGLLGLGISLALFFLGKNRATRWAGLFTSVLTMIATNTIMTGFPVPLLLIPLWLIALAIPAIPFFIESNQTTKEKSPDDLD